HVVLPADDRTDSAERRVHGVERRPVAESPDESFRTGGHELPMRTGDPGAGVEHEGGAVEGVSEAFDDADDDEESELSGRLGQSFDFRPVERDRAGAVAFVLPAPVVRAQTDRGAERAALRVAADE